MKSLKITLFIWLLIGYSISVKSQNLETIKVYYDYSKTRLSEIYTVIKNTGTKHGLYKSYDKDGTLVLEMTFKNNIVNGISKTYYSLGHASLDKNPMNSYGKLKEAFTYVNGKLEGSSKLYDYDTGKQVLKFDRIYKNGELEKETEFYSNGNKKQLVQLNGICNNWYETGEKLFEYTSVNGVNVGLHTEWFKNGKINVLGNYNNNGKEEGTWKIWNENGILTETVYKNGIDIEKERVKKEAQMKYENEQNEKIKKEEEEYRLKKEAELAAKKLKEDNDQKDQLVIDRIKNIKEKSEQIEKLYNVVDNIQTALLGKETYKIKKRNLYSAYIVLRNDLYTQISNNKNVDEKLILSETLINLFNKVIDLSQQNTKEIEKELKNVVDINKIKDVFKV